MQSATYLLVEDDLSLSALVSLEPVEPAPAAPLGLELELELEGEELDDAPPLAGLFVESLEPLEELELEGDDALPEGEVVEPEGDVPRSLERLQPVTTAVPSARVTASANVESLMRPPW